jgi:hypothetical protein
VNASKQIDNLIRDTTDWRGEVLARLREIVLSADSGIVEEWKWMGTPTWSKNSVICIANPHKGKVKLTFSDGAALQDPDKLFNAMLEGNKWRAIDFFEGDKINERALKALIKEAVAYDALKARGSAGKTKGSASKATRSTSNAKGSAIAPKSPASKAKGSARTTRTNGRGSK